MKIPRLTNDLATNSASAKTGFSVNLNLLCFLLPLFLIGTLNFCLPNKPTVSELESRTLKTKPVFAWDKLFTGNLAREYEEYFADNFLWREKFVQVSGKFKEFWALPGKNRVALVVNKGANVAQTQNNPPSDENTPHPNKITSTNNVLVLNDQAMELHTFDPSAAKGYADFLNKFQTALKKSEEVTVYSLLAPTQIEFISEKAYRDISAPQKKTIDFLNSCLNAGIVVVDAYSALQKHSGEYLYFRSDHHWTALGAYYAYTAFMNAQGLEPVPLQQYETEEIKPFLGSLYSTTLSEAIRNNPDTVLLYKPFTAHQYAVYYEKYPIKTSLLDMRHAENKNKYGIFLGGDVPWGHITTEIENDRKIAVIKDSYANALIPFLLPHYEEIFVIDPRQFQQDIFQFIKKHDIREVLFLNYILVTNDEGFTDLLNQMTFPGR